MNKRNILVPIDFSEISEAGLKTAIDIANQIDANIHLLHIVEEHSDLGFKTDADMESSAREASEHDHFMVELIKKTKQQVDDLLLRYKSEKIKLIPFVEFGDYEEQLNIHLKENPTDMVVMDTSGETNISEFFSGNHASQAIRIANVPVLAVKAYYPIIAKDNMLILISLKDYDLQKVGLIKKFADIMQLNVLIGHVKQFKDVIKSDLYAELQKFALDNNFSIVKSTL
ncbi:MAG: universal stress protein [Cyclobacteriaceae bacterium]|nr:universal stress protein [Cyclobacteriaceae bacterium]